MFKDEVCAALLDLGVVVALNLDGGGSTTTWYARSSLPSPLSSSLPPHCDSHYYLCHYYCPLSITAIAPVLTYPLTPDPHIPGTMVTTPTVLHATTMSPRRASGLWPVCSVSCLSYAFLEIEIYINI